MWVHLKGPEDLIAARLAQRPGHFMKADMLASQLDALEEPSGAIVADVTAPPESIVDGILKMLNASSDAPDRV